MSVWENDNSLMLLLTKINFNDKYEIELRRLPFHQQESGSFSISFIYLFIKCEQL